MKAIEKFGFIILALTFAIFIEQYGFRQLSPCEDRSYYCSSVEAMKKCRKELECFKLMTPTDERVIAVRVYPSAPTRPIGNKDYPRDLVRCIEVGMKPHTCFRFFSSYY